MKQTIFFSWKDVERHCRMAKEQWMTDFDAIEVYPSEMIVYKREHSRPVSQVLQELFQEKYEERENFVRLDIGGIVLPVREEISEGEYNKPTLPLFKDILYHHTAYPEQDLPLLPKPLIAFHSYKGGVGRTLSLLAFAKAWSAEFAEEKNASLLLVDSDIEAPGLTWIQDKPFEDTLSYLDLLTLIQDNNDVDRIVELACSRLKMATISVETPTRTVEHYFIPTYRYEEQLMDLYATPESIVNGKKKEYVLAEVLSKICERLDLSAALVDLRAGISEFSATLLLDPRVKKYLVTSTSTQSIKGTQILLKHLMKGLQIHEDTVVPEIFLNMVPDTLSESEKSDMISGLLQCYERGQQGDEDNSFTDNVITELPFASELIHLTSMRQIIQSLNGRGIYLKLQRLVRQNFYEETSPPEQLIDENKRRQILSKINTLANAQLTAESNNKFEVLMTKPLKYLGKKYSDSIPTTVIMGAKGAGKTFLYREMAESLCWNSFCTGLYGATENVMDGFFLPVIATRNSHEIIEVLKKCIDSLNTSIPDAQVNNSVFLDNQQKLERQKSEPTDWVQFWQELLTSSIHPELKNFQETDEKLQKCGKRIVFLIDGLEDILKKVPGSAEECNAIQALCQDIVTQLVARYHNLGIIIFLRRDMAKAAIRVNFTQFEQLYKQFELKWSSNEALRLAVWLVNKADDYIYQGSAAIDVVSQDIIETSLIRLWGLKLGRPSSNEAYSSRWILAALSDFNGQLQARDIIRFLKYATQRSDRKPPYNDRILMPMEIRGAVSTCSNEKLEEVKQEYVALKPIFEKLEQIPAEEKSLPLDPNHARLSSLEEQSMIQEGYLKRDGDKYYLPEIARHALGFRYGKGARPKVLSLTLKQ